MEVLITLLNSRAMKLSATGPRCFSMAGDMPSGPMDFEFLAALITFKTSLAWKKTVGSESVGVLSFLRSVLKVFVSGIFAAGVYWAFN